MAHLAMRSHPASLRRRLLSVLPWPLLAALITLGVEIMAWRNGVSGRLLAIAPLAYLLLMAWAAWRSDGLKLVGPLFWYDCARLARSRRTTQLRTLYGLLLLAWLCWLFASRFPTYLQPSSLFAPGPVLSLSIRASLAYALVSSLLMLQGTAIFIVTPVYLASAIAEEKERRTLEFLFTTSLIDREIILGKLFGRVIHLLSMLLLGLPILFIIQVWGGVDGMMLLGCFVIAVLTLLSVSSIGMMCSVLTPNVLFAILSSYALVALFTFSCWRVPACAAPVALEQFNQQFSKEMREWDQQVAAVSRFAKAPILGRLPAASSGFRAGRRGSVPPPGTPGGTVPSPPSSSDLVLKMMELPLLFHLGVFLVCTMISIFALRGVPRQRPAVSLAMRGDDPELNGWGPWEEPETYVSSRPRRSAGPGLSVRQPALLWKEACLGALLPDGLHLHKVALRRWRQLALLGVAVSIFCLLLSQIVPEAITRYILQSNRVVRQLTIGLAGIWFVCVGFRTAGSICRERAQNTWDGLLMLPGERQEILRAKWRGALLRYRVVGYALLAVWLVGLFTGVLHPWAVLLLAATCGVYLLFLMNLGLWLSLVCRTTKWANLAMAVVLLLVFVGSRVSVVYVDLDPYGTHKYWPLDLAMSLLQNGIDPAHTLWILGFTWTEFASRIGGFDAFYWQDLSRAIAEVVLLSLLAWALWRLVCRRFRLEVDSPRGRWRKGKAVVARLRSVIIGSRSGP